MKDYLKFLISILIPLFAGFLGSFSTSSSLDEWYPTLIKPSFNPPNWVFAPVWTILFILIGISFYFVWKKDFDKKRNILLTIYILQIFLNICWSFFFFGLKNPLLAFLDIILLWFLILINIFLFYKVEKISGILLVPYLLWVSFATILNYYILILN